MSTDVMKEITVGNKTLTIWYDQFVENPCDEWFMGTYDFFGRRQHLGTNPDSKYYEGVRKKYGSREEYERELKQIVRKGGVVLPVFAYEHGGIALKTTEFSCPWDSGQIGYAYITTEQIASKLGFKKGAKGRKKAAETLLKGEIQTLSSWANGEIYGFTLEEGDELVESIGGFYEWKDFDTLLDEMKENVSEEHREIFDAMKEV